MKLEFSPALQLAFDRARLIAINAHAAEVDACHLLCGLLSEEEGKATQALIAAGVDWLKLQTHLQLTNPIEKAPDTDVTLDPDLAEVMTSARELASIHGDEGTIATDHMLLALLLRSEPICSELQTFGFDLKRLEAHIVGGSTPLVMDEPLLLTASAEEANTARILDASANRAREALRVLEDYTRFGLDDAFLTGRLKQLRHDLAQALGELPASMLLQARDTLNDVGTTIDTEAEWQRPSLDAVVQANAKRLQEALRSLEEYGKIVSIEFARQIEMLRYQTYTLERAIVQGASARDRLADAQLYVLVTDSFCKASLVGTVKEAALGGAQIIQLREKGIDDRALLSRARNVRDVTRSTGTLFIVNDRPDIARLVDADGVHLGQDDMPIREARRIVGANALIGVSTHNLDQLRRAILEGADYVGIGPTFPSTTKTFLSFAGLEFVKQALAETSLPAYALGGINLENVEQLRAVGVRRIAVSSAICAAADPRGVAQRLRRALLAV
jgi:thiamine-phosphate pyrophosphorylase